MFPIGRKSYRYCKTRDTFMIESFNMIPLLDVPENKGIKAS